MLDKFKRYRLRQKEGRVGVKLEVKVFLRRATGLPGNASSVVAQLAKGGRTTEFRDCDLQKGMLARRLPRGWKVLRRLVLQSQWPHLHQAL